jgi:outer membrane lipoprotein-sorting protein
VRRVPPPDDVLTDPSAVLELLRQRAEGSGAITSLAADSRVSYYSSDGARKGKLVILARRPASLHFSALSPTDDLVAFLASDGARFTSFERGSSVCEVGDACAANVGSLLPIPMEGAELVGLLISSVPIMKHERATVSWDPRAGAYRLELVDGARSERIWVDHGSGRVRVAELWDGRKRQVRIGYSEFQRHGELSLAHEIHVEAARNNVDLKIRYRDVELNGSIDDDAFAIACPDGTRQVEVPCTGGSGGQD